MTRLRQLEKLIKTTINGSFFYKFEEIIRGLK